MRGYDYARVHKLFEFLFCHIGVLVDSHDERSFRVSIVFFDLEEIGFEILKALSNAVL